MKNLEFFSNISIGQYIDSNSLFHSLRPATKYLLLLGLMVLAIGAPTLAGAGFAFIAALVLAQFSWVPLSFLLRSLKPIFPVIILSFILQFLFQWPGDRSATLISLGIFSLTIRELWIVAMILIRAAAMMTIVGWFTSITTEAEAAKGIEDIARPFSSKTFPIHRLALAVAAAIRFIPIIAGELEEIVKAQASRGADFGQDTKGLLAKARAYLPLFVPVTIRALERAEMLAEAMEARCYTGEGQTVAPKTPMKRPEWFIRVFSPVIVIGVLVVDVYFISTWIRPY